MRGDVGQLKTHYPGKIQIKQYVWFPNATVFIFNVIVWSTKIQITLNKLNILWILMFKLQYLYRQIIQLYSFSFVQKKTPLLRKG